MKKQRTHFCFSQVTSLALAASLSISAASGMTALAAEPVEVVPVEAVEAVEVLPEAVIEAEEVESSFEAGMAVSPGVNYFSDQTYSFTEGLPWNTSELAQIVDYENPASVAACVVAAFVRATDNFNDGDAMIRKLYEPKSPFGVTHAPSGFDSIFTTHLKESYRKWVPRSYFEGGTAYNGYTPTRPWTINLTYNSQQTDTYRNTPSVGGLGIEPIIYTIKSKAVPGLTTVNIVLYRYPGDSRWYAHSFEGMMYRGVDPTTEGSNDDGFTHGGGGSDDPTPVIETGWKKGNNGYMYVRADGSMPKNKWEKIGGVYYHFDADGYMQTGWFKEGKKWYYLKSSGAMATGWLKISGKYYYFNSSGVMQSNAWVKSGGKWYYMNSSGVMATGWLKISGKYYYFNSSGVMQSSAWVKSGGKWYYMDSSGVMVAGTSKKIGKKTYRFNASGVCLNP